MTLSRYRHAVYSLFFVSGISGLVYQIVWLRMLSRIMGVTIYATSTVLAAFMAGLALGSFLFGRLADRRTDLLRLYALLEMFIGCTALCIPLVPDPVAFPVSLDPSRFTGNRRWPCRLSADPRPHLIPRPYYPHHVDGRHASDPDGLPRKEGEPFWQEL